MPRFSFHKSLFIIPLLLALLIGSGCHSSRTTVRGSQGRQKEKTEKRPQSQAAAERIRVVDGSRNKLVEEARRWIGTPYAYGGHQRGKGTDCSGLTMEIYQNVLGKKIPRNSAEQQKFCSPLKREKLQAGDLVFFTSKRGGEGRVSHVGLYVDDGVFVHASTSRGVIASSLEEEYYRTHYHSAGRVPGVKEEKPAKTKPSRQKKEPVLLPVNSAVSLSDSVASRPPDSIPSVSPRTKSLPTTDPNLKAVPDSSPVFEPDTVKTNSTGAPSESVSVPASNRSIGETPAVSTVRETVKSDTIPAYEKAVPLTPRVLPPPASRENIADSIARRVRMAF